MLNIPLGTHTFHTMLNLALIIVTVTTELSHQRSSKTEQMQRHPDRVYSVHLKQTTSADVVLQNLNFKCHEIVVRLCFGHAVLCVRILLFVLVID